MSAAEIDAVGRSPGEPAAAAESGARRTAGDLHRTTGGYPGSARDHACSSRSSPASGATTRCRSRSSARSSPSMSSRTGAKAASAASRSCDTAAWATRCRSTRRNDDVILQFGLKKPAYRIVVNSPTTHGSIGLTTGLDPAMTLGCGGYGGNITSDNISPRHLLNIKRLAYEIKPAVVRPIAAIVFYRGSRPAVAEGSVVEAPSGLAAESLARRIDQFLASRGYSAPAGRPAAAPAASRRPPPHPGRRPQHQRPPRQRRRHPTNPPISSAKTTCGRR